MNTAGAGKKGFTLLELLIVIAIIAVLSTLLIVVLDPSETLKRTRDSQRVADLNTMKTAIGIYLAESPNPSLDSGQGDCLNGSAGVGRITYSYNGSPPLTTCYTSAPPLGSDAAGSLSANILNTVPTNPTFGSEIARALNPISTALAFGPPNPFCTSVSSTAYTAVNGTGWIPINFTSLIGGSPIAALPVDPVNTIANFPSVASTDPVYRYLCQSQTVNSTLPAHAYQLAAVLESALYGASNPTGLDSKDGSPNPAYYEVGSDSNLMPPTSTSW